MNQTGQAFGLSRFVLEAVLDNAKNVLIKGGVRKSRVSRTKQRKQAEHFLAGATARPAGEWVGACRKGGGVGTPRPTTVVGRARCLSAPLR